MVDQGPYESPRTQEGVWHLWVGLHEGRTHSQGTSQTAWTKIPVQKTFFKLYENINFIKIPVQKTFLN